MIEGFVDVNTRGWRRVCEVIFSKLCVLAATHLRVRDGYGGLWSQALLLAAMGSRKARARVQDLERNQYVSAKGANEGKGNIPCASATKVLGSGAVLETLLLARWCALIVRPA